MGKSINDTDRDMINLTIGPVMTSKSVKSIGGEDVPYFRTSEFSDMMIDNENLIKEFARCEEGGRVVFLTGSGTAAMEAAVINSFDESDKILVVDGGNFGHRFVDLLELYEIPYEALTPKFGQDITENDLMEYDGRGFTGFLVNLDETTFGVLYDIEVISRFCKRNDLFLIVDSISSFLCDPFDMEDSSVDMMLAGSQKALACPPGISIIVMSKRAVSRVADRHPKTLYFDLKEALKDGERGQTPYTPAVGILRQINCRLHEIKNAGGVDGEVYRTGRLAEYFRRRIKDEELPFEFVVDSMSNAVTSLTPINNVSANDIFLTLKDEYGIWICPNGGEFKDEIFRVGHIGALSEEHFDKLIGALKDMRERDLI